jgi:predicted HAD superfamily phosphohydrolase YqeG
MIGDELLVDIMIPKKLGMHTILLDRANEFRNKPQEADKKANTLIEAIAFAENWHKS